VFEIDKYCLSFDGAITLHLKPGYLDDLFSYTLSKRHLIRKWHFYTPHLNSLYLPLGSFTLTELKLAYFNLEEVTTQNTNMVPEHRISVSERSHHTIAP